MYRYNSSTNGADLVTQTNSLGDGVSAIGIGDMDGDGKKEIIWGSDYVSSGRDYLVVASWTPSMGVLWSGPMPAVLDGPFVGAKSAHLAANQDRLMFMTASSQSGYGGTRLMALDPVSGAVSVSSEIDSNWSRNYAFDVGDVTGSGIDAMLVGTANLYTNYFTAYDFDSIVIAPRVDDRGSRRDHHFGRRSDGDDAVILHQNRGVVERRTAVAVEHHAADQCQARCRLRARASAGQCGEDTRRRAAPSSQGLGFARKNIVLAR